MDQSTKGPHDRTPTEPLVDSAEAQPPREAPTSGAGSRRLGESLAPGTIPDGAGQDVERETADPGDRQSIGGSAHRGADAVPDEGGAGVGTKAGARPS